VDQAQQWNGAKPRFVPRQDALRLHSNSILSNLLATAKEAVGVAPKVREIQALAFVRKAGWVRKDKLNLVCAISLSRERMSAMDWEQEPLSLIQSLEDVLISVAEDKDVLRCCPLTSMGMTIFARSPTNWLPHWITASDP
jgi:hypothetical protein